MKSREAPRGLGLPALLLVLLAAAAPACSAVGTFVRETGAAGGAAAGAAIGGPGGAAVGAVLGGVAGEYGAEAVSGTTALRVPSAPVVSEVELPLPVRAMQVGSEVSMNLEIIIAILLLAAALRELWALKAKDKEQQKQLDELWDHFMRGK